MRNSRDPAPRPGWNEPGGWLDRANDSAFARFIDNTGDFVNRAIGGDHFSNADNAFRSGDTSQGWRELGAGAATAGLAVGGLMSAGGAVRGVGTIASNGVRTALASGNRWGTAGTAAGIYDAQWTARGGADRDVNDLFNVGPRGPRERSMPTWGAGSNTNNRTNSDGVRIRPMPTWGSGNRSLITRDPNQSRYSSPVDGPRPPARHQSSGGGYVDVNPGTIPGALLDPSMAALSAEELAMLSEQRAAADTNYNQAINALTNRSDTVNARMRTDRRQIGRRAAGSAQNSKTQLAFLGLGSSPAPTQGAVDSINNEAMSRTAEVQREGAEEQASIRNQRAQAESLRREILQQLALEELRAKASRTGNGYGRF